MRVTRKNGYWQASTPAFTAEVSPRGGKIRRLLSAASGRNFFFQDPRRSFGGADFIQNDISGFDECFPTVGRARSRFGRDHGLLWDQTWTMEPDQDSLRAWVEHPGGLPVRFERRIRSPRSEVLRLEYCVHNLSRRPLPFIYSSHPILALEPGSKISLPGIENLSVLGHNGLLKANRRQTWPVARLTAGPQARLDTDFHPTRGLAGKWFAKGLGCSRITFPGSGEALVLRWDHRELPYLGIWISLGIPLGVGGQNSDWVCVALEPCTYPHDILDVRKNQTLVPGQKFEFWMEWEIIALGRKRHEHGNRQEKTA